MKPELLMSIRRMVLRSLATACLLLGSSRGFVLAQSAKNYCEPSPEIKEELNKVSKVSDEDLPYKLRRERQSAMLRDLLRKYPDDFHVQKRYLNDRRYDFFTDREMLLAEYRTLMGKNPNDAGAVYLYARFFLVGQKTKGAIEQLEKLVQRAPDFPWSYLELAEIYNYPNFRDAAKSKENLRQWLAKCPLATEGFRLVSGSGDKELMTQTAQRLRARLQASTANDDLGYWDDLWTLAFKLKPIPEHPQVRQQIAEDLKRIRAKNLNSKEWFLALQSGYKMVDDKEGRRWAEDEFLRLFPKSDAARLMADGYG